MTMGGQRWNVVGVFDAGGSAFDSEVWCDVHLLNGAFKRPADTFSVCYRAPHFAGRVSAV